MISTELDKVLQKVDEILAPQPALKFEVVKDSVGLFDSKIGGTPYFPKDMEYPKGRKKPFDGKPLVLLAQLNFEQLPHIPDFPTKGILQFFIAADDLYGMSPDYGNGLTNQDNFRVIYHENIITDESKLITANDIPNYSPDDDFYLPFSGEYKLKALEPDVMRAVIYDYRFSDVFVNCYNELYGEEAEDIWDIVEEDDYNALAERNDTTTDAFIGGYPVFTQDDPRYDESIADCDTVLFELDSVYKPGEGIDILWGDMGTGTFLIPRDNLRKLDFSRVVYNYDCS